MSELETREFEIRGVDTEAREVSGIAVPWDTPTDLGWITEIVARDAVQDSDDALLFWRHSEPIGKIVKAKSTDAGWEIVAKISQTPRGDEAYTLLQDGVISRMSIGFEPQEQSLDVENSTVTRTKIRVREVSLVPFPAYKEAVVSQVREASTKENDMTITAADLDELRANVEDLDRRVQAMPVVHTEARPDTRSAGEILKAIVAGDQATIDGYENLQRAYTGGTTSDAVVKAGWVGNLTRIFDASSGVLAETFSTGTLPDSGMSIEYAELLTNTVDVAEVAEGADMSLGKVSITTKTAAVKTYAGGAQLTRQEIERSTVGVLNTTLDALSMAAGARKKAVLRTNYDALVTARRAVASDAGVVLLNATLAAGTASNWEDCLIDAAIKYHNQNLPMEVLIVSGTVFKKLRSLTVSGERVFQTWKDNASGQLNLPGLTGQLAGLPVKLDPGQTGDSAIFANARALRQYDSPLVSLSDENIVSLSKTFAVYKYGAVAAEIPGALVPVKFS